MNITKITVSLNDEDFGEEVELIYSSSTKGVTLRDGLSLTNFSTLIFPWMSDVLDAIPYPIQTHSWDLDAEAKHDCNMHHRPWAVISEHSTYAKELKRKDDACEQEIKKREAIYKRLSAALPMCITPTTCMPMEHALEYCISKLEEIMKEREAEACTANEVSPDEVKPTEVTNHITKGINNGTWCGFINLRRTSPFVEPALEHHVLCPDCIKAMRNASYDEEEPRAGDAARTRLKQKLDRGLKPRIRTDSGRYYF